MCLKKNITVIVVLLILSYAGFSQKLKRNHLFGSANIGSGPPYGIIGGSIEMGYYRYSLHMGVGMAEYTPFAVTGGVKYYYYFFKRIKSLRGRSGILFGTIEHETKTALSALILSGFEYWFKNYITFNMDLSFPFKKDFYFTMLSLGVGYNITTQIQHVRNKKDDKIKVKKVPKPTF